MNNRLDYIQKARELTGSTDMTILIKAAKELEEYIENGNEALGLPSRLVDFLPYTKIIHPVRGGIKFDSYPFQKDFALRLQRHVENPNGTLMHCTARQMGASLMLQSLAVWFALSSPNQRVLFLVNRMATGKEMLDRMVYSLVDIPYTFGGIQSKRLGVITFTNGSEIVFKTMGSSNALAGLTDEDRNVMASPVLIQKKPSLVIFMDAAYVSFANDIEFEKVIDAIDKEIPVVMSSSLNTPRGLFYKKLISADASNKIVHGWQSHPDRSEEWKQQSLKWMGGDEDKFATEFECRFKDD